MKALDNQRLVCLLVAIAICLAALSSGCAVVRDLTRDLTAEESVRPGNLPDYFDQIPADTVFFAGGSEPLPTNYLSTARSLVGSLEATPDVFYPDLVTVRE
ncbi:MAG: hypothetical protein ACOCV2_02130, partial [Persicimonas sp.]